MRGLSPGGAPSRQGTEPKRSVGPAGKPSRRSGSSPTPAACLIPSGRWPICRAAWPVSCSATMASGSGRRWAGRLLASAASGGLRSSSRATPGLPAPCGPGCISATGAGRRRSGCVAGWSQARRTRSRICGAPAARVPPPSSSRPPSRPGAIRKRRRWDRRAGETSQREPPPLAPCSRSGASPGTAYGSSRARHAPGREQSARWPSEACVELATVFRNCHGRRS